MNQRLLNLLLAGGTFPTGGFSQSYGLETYVFDGRIDSCEAFRQFLKVYIQRVLARCEGPYFCAAYDCSARGNLERLSELNTELTAMRLSSESRAASHRTGKSFLRVVSSICEDETLVEVYKKHSKAGINYPIAFGLTAEILNMEKKPALEAFFYSEANNLAQAALKLIPLGNAQAQEVLLHALRDIDAAVEQTLVLDLEEADNFCPGLDIASIRHETLPVRLYMS